MYISEIDRNTGDLKNFKLYYNAVNFVDMVMPNDGHNLYIVSHDPPGKIHVLKRDIKSGENDEFFIIENDSFANMTQLVFTTDGKQAFGAGGTNRNLLFFMRDYVYMF